MFQPGTQSSRFLCATWHSLTNIPLRAKETVKLTHSIVSSAWLCQQRHCRGAGIRHPSVNSGFSETAAWIQAKFCRKLLIRQISRPFFLFKFYDFIFPFRQHGTQWTQWEPTFQSAISPSFGPTSTKLHDKYVSHWRIQSCTFLENKKKYGTLKFSLTQDHVGLEISKRYSYSFHPKSAKLYEDIDYHGGIQANTFLGNLRSFKKIVVLWKFNMGVNGKS